MYTEYKTPLAPVNSSAYKRLKVWFNEVFPWPYYYTEERLTDDTAELVVHSIQNYEARAIDKAVNIAFGTRFKA